jgi:hypothetical protein
LSCAAFSDCRGSVVDYFIIRDYKVNNSRRIINFVQ